jgi:hypothetical protein
VVWTPLAGTRGRVCLSLNFLNDELYRFLVRNFGHLAVPVYFRLSQSCPRGGSPILRDRYDVAPVSDNTTLRRWANLLEPSILAALNTVQYLRNICATASVAGITESLTS